ncbi:hypothetical protein [Homoserinimonas hongtaonis]|uniref:DUF2238 domain-containing protein n=1 Tax=Homoserinimonas hongtaonis TaxID=2079791 RepID=A0A2U1T278_9MICO|nr:hypothetical protein [Salinibacterium hongtaonis]PWB97958.1 hypothetical protein DF220_09060 [Salinibacterium hongtaonis]
MKLNFLRPPRTIGEWCGDLLRVAGLVCVVIGITSWSLADGGILALALPGLVLPRLLGVKAWFDVVFGITVLISVWSNVLDLYTTVPGWDLVVHFVLTGLTAVLLYLLFARYDIVGEPDRSGIATVVLATTMGLALSAMWEVFEWFGWAFISETIYVAYQDTIGDMVAGGVGSFVAALLLASVPLLRADAVPSENRRPTVI